MYVMRRRPCDQADCRLFVDRHAQTVTTPFSGSHLVTSHLNRIILRRTQDLQIERTWALPIDVPVQRPLRENNNAASSLAASTSRPANKTATETSPLTSLSVSPAEPHFVLAYSAKERAAWVLDPAEGEPVARFDVGAEGALAMTWSETGDTIIAWSALHVSLGNARLNEVLTRFYSYAYHYTVYQRHRSPCTFTTRSWHILMVSCTASEPKQPANGRACRLFLPLCRCAVPRRCGAALFKGLCRYLRLPELEATTREHRRSLGVAES